MEKKCKSGGAYRSEEGYLEEVCAFCFRDMPYGEKNGVIQQLDDGIRICEGRCEYACDYVNPYGFVPEAGCKVHDIHPIAKAYNQLQEWLGGKNRLSI